jgi:H/ACA ribonucleoprotein complex non-core subunit NAF1
MATEEIDEIASQAPPAKRARRETSNDMEADKPETLGTSVPDNMELDKMDNTVASVTEAVKETSNQLGNTEPAPLLDHSPSQITIPDVSTEVEGVIMPANATAAASSPPLTHTLEALLGGVKSTPASTTQEAPVSDFTVGNTPEEVKTTAMETEDVTTAEGDLNEGEHLEWEIDSSPIESSSDDSSSDDSSSDESEDGDNAYKLLSPEEQARILMEGDGGSDDEGGDKGTKGSGNQLRTKNEIPEEVIPKPDVTITPEMPIEELGTVEGIVENTVLIKAKTSGEYRVLDSGSVLCLEDRSVIGVVSETIGRVQQPLYSVRFTNTGEIAEAGLSAGTKVFYSEQHSKYVFTQTLKAFKGSDASNLHDEEVGDEEIEFSDDEAEAEHKRRLKQKKVDKRGGRTQQNGGQSRGHPLQQQHAPGFSNEGIRYDDGEDDGPYKPLARPAGYADTIGWGEAPQEGTFARAPDGSPPRVHENRGIHNLDRDQFRGRGRGDRGRAQGDRGGGRGRGSYHDRRGGGSGYSLPPQGRSNDGYAPPAQSSGFAQPPYQSPQGKYFNTPQIPTIAPPPNNYNNPLHQPYSPHQPQLPTWPHYPPQPQPPFQQQPYPQPFPNAQNGWPNMPLAPPLPTGAFINPAFFNGGHPGNPNQWNQQSQQGGRGRGGPQ